MMSRIKIHQEIKVYEIDGEDALLDCALGVDSHWNYATRVVLTIEGKTFSVVGDNLKVAIDNAMNSGK